MILVGNLISFIDFFPISPGLDVYKRQIIVVPRISPLTVWTSFRNFRVKQSHIPYSKKYKIAPVLKDSNPEIINMVDRIPLTLLIFMPYSNTISIM